MSLTRVVAAQTGEPVSRSDRREVRILVAEPRLTVTWSRYAAGERGPDLHIHREHTDAFYVLGGTLRFGVGSRGATVDVGPGGFVAVPARVAHSFANEGDEEANWLNFHAPDCGFAAYLRSGTGWDSFDVPADGGADPAAVVVSGRGEGVKADLPELAVEERWVDAAYEEPQAAHAFVIEGSIEAGRARVLGVRA